MTVRVIGGRKVLRKIMEDFLRELYKYNSIVKEYGYYLKPYHVVTYKSSSGIKKYYYYGRYWYKIKYAGKKGKTSLIKWEYVGRTKPLEKLPDPPKHPLENTVFLVENEDVLLRDEDYLRLKKYFRSLSIVIEPERKI